MENNKCPCEQCILLAMCVNRKRIYCDLLAKYMGKHKWPKVLPKSINILTEKRHLIRWRPEYDTSTHGYKGFYE